MGFPPTSAPSGGGYPPPPMDFNHQMNNTGKNFGSLETPPNNKYNHHHPPNGDDEGSFLDQIKREWQGAMRGEGHGGERKFSLPNGVDNMRFQASNQAFAGVGDPPAHELRVKRFKTGSHKYDCSYKALSII